MARCVPSSHPTLYVAPPSDLTGIYWPGIGPVLTPGDDNTGLGTPAHPFATPQRAHDEFALNYDFAFRYKPTIQLASKTNGTIYYPAIKISGRLIGQGGSVPPLIAGNGIPPVIVGNYLPYTLRGDPANPYGLMIWPRHFNQEQPPVSLSEGGLNLEGLIVASDGIQQDCIDVFEAILALGNVIFGPAGGGPTGTGNHYVCINTVGGFIIPTAGLTVAGAIASFIQAQRATILPNQDGSSPNIPLTIINNIPVEQGFFLADAASVMYTEKFDITGSITGVKKVEVRGGIVMHNPWFDI